MNASPKDKIVSFKAAAESRKGSDDRRQAETPYEAPERRQETTPRRSSGYTEAWLKANTDKDALIKENLALKKQRNELAAQQQNLTPTLGEHLVYYASLAFSVGILLGLIMLAR